MADFLISRQKHDGGFAETLNLDHLIEDKYGVSMGREWYPVGKSVMWLTGKALEALCLASYKDEERLRRARDFLLYSQHEDGHWPDYKGQDISDPLGTGNILPALRAVGVPSDHKVYKNGRAALMQHLLESVEQSSTYDMVDLYAVRDATNGKEREVLDRGINLILNSQNSDGGWAPEGSKKSDPELSSLLAAVVNTCCKH
jgi:squalene cyclase